MEDSVATSLDEVVGRYTDVELRKNTDVNTAWLSSEPLTQYEYLTRLNGSKVAISVTIPTFAKGGSGKVEAGDIIMLFATDKDTGETTQPPELKYVEVLAPPRVPARTRNIRRRWKMRKKKTRRKPCPPPSPCW